MPSPRRRFMPSSNTVEPTSDVDLIEMTATMPQPLPRLIASTVIVAITLSGCNLRFDDRQRDPSPSAVSGPTERSSPRSAPRPAVFMSYNICHTEPWCSQNPGAPELSVRTERVLERIATSAPDVLAVQEGLSLFSGVDNVTYDASGRATSTISEPRLESRAGEPSVYFTEASTGTAYTVAFDPTVLSGIGIYINPTRYSLIQHNGEPEIETLLLGTDPQLPAEFGSERMTPRYASFAHLRDIESGEAFWVGTIHATEGQHPLEIAERLEEMSTAAERTFILEGPMIFAGDFNHARTEHQDDVLDILGDGFADAQDLADTVENAEINSAQGWTLNPRRSYGPIGRHIDRILVRGDVDVTMWAIQSFFSGSQWRSVASDHPPFVAEFVVGSQTYGK